MTSEKIRQQNMELCRKYPFLVPTSRWSGKKITTKEKGYWPSDPDKIPEYHYDYTELDAMPSGWRKAFGLQLCEELKQELEKANALDAYRIIDIKEKYGSLRWYDNYNTDEGYKIIYKYSKLSAQTCIACGAPATVITTDWISPYCDDCVPKRSPWISIEDYQKEIQEEDAALTE